MGLGKDKESAKQDHLPWKGASEDLALFSWTAEEQGRTLRGLSSFRWYFGLQSHNGSRGPSCHSTNPF